MFPSLQGLEPTRLTLQLYSRLISAVPRAHGEFHPRWWHISLKVQPDGLVSDEVSLPDGRALRFKMDLVHHEIVLTVDGEQVRSASMMEGLSSSALAEDLLGTVAELGLDGEYDRERFENHEPREYDPEAAGRFLTALTSANRIFEQHRATLDGDPGIVQLWPHDFDLAFEWYGSRVEVHEEQGQEVEVPAQLNLGFYPGGPGIAPYFYSNPWPFEGELLLGEALPHGASWHTEGWLGTILPYEELAGDPDAGARLLDYARRVYDLCAATLMSGTG